MEVCGMFVRWTFERRQGKNDLFQQNTFSDKALFQN